MLANRLNRFRRKPPAPPSVPGGVRLYAIGDIHGRSDVLQKALSWIESDAKSYPDKRIVQLFLGDYIDRGMNSRQVLDQLTAPPPDGHDRICLMGNHEATLLDFLGDASVLRSWMNYGGLPTLDSYGVELPLNTGEQTHAQLQAQFKAALPEAHLAFLQSLRSHYELGDYYFVHAGVRPNVPLSEQQERDQFWIREPFLSHKKPFEKCIIHGHTPLAAPVIYPNRINLDVNEAPEDMLACLILQEQSREIELIIAD